jgi:glycosyltransferase involved in cell wall biosynthesis
MKVLVITPSYPRYQGDYHGSFVQSYCHEISKYTDLSVLAPRSRTLVDYPEEFNISRFPYLPLQKTEYIAEQTMKNAPFPVLATLPFYLISAYLNLIKHSKDLIHLHIAIPLGLPVIYANKNAPIVITCHGSDLTYPIEKSFLRPFCRKIFRKASRVITVSRFLQKYLTEYEVKSIVIPIGVNVNRFYPAKKSKSKINIGVLGRLVPEKRVQDTIKSMKLIEHKLDYQLHIAGDGPELLKLRMLAEKYKINSIFYGRIKYPEIFLRNCNIFILSSIREGLSTSLQEAMACGCIPIAVDNIGCEELISHGENGYLFTPGKIHELSHNIITAANKPELGKKARQTILKNYDIKKNSLRYLEEYLKLIE